MDESTPHPPVPEPSAAGPRLPVRFVPDRRYTALAAGGVVAAAVAVLASQDAAGRVLAAVAGLLLLAYVVTDLVFSPRVVACAEGVVLNTPLVRAWLSWPEIEDVRADVRLRRGLRSTALEIDAGSTLAVLSRRAIGVDPAVAAEQILACRPPR